MPLLELFAVADSVFTEDDALSEENRMKTLGRLYRSWKETRAQLDEDFEEDKDAGVRIRPFGSRL